MTNPTIQIDITEILNELKTDQKKILEEVNNLKTGQAEIKGEIKSLDSKVDQLDKQLDKRITNQEFLNRGIFVGMLLIVLGGIAKFSGWTPNA